jgi:5-hydroxyisourate hydrolase-like protein (transthyretin family)
VRSTLGRTAAAVVLAAAVLLNPAQAFAAKLTAPIWDVYVVDAHGDPVVGIAVTETRRYHGCESKDHSETLFTNAEGRVRFSPKFLKESKAGAFKCDSEVTGKLLFFQDTHCHASITVGSTTSALVGSDVDKNGRPVEWAGKPDHMTSHIVAHPPIVMK